LDVFHGFKFVREELGDHDALDVKQEKDWVRARPSSARLEEHFDTVVIMRSDQCESTGVEGEF